MLQEQSRLAWRDAAFVTVSELTSNRASYAPAAKFLNTHSGPWVHLRNPIVGSSSRQVSPVFVGRELLQGLPWTIRMIS